jgi:urease accessory protein
MPSGDDPARLLAALRLGDSAFPGGGFAFSGGLEGLAADGRLPDASAVAGAVRDQALGRWLPCDRVALAQAHRAADRLAEVVEIDDALDALTLARELREGGRQNGMGLLTAHARLGTPGLEAYRAAVLDGRTPGQLAVVQGVVWRAAGLDEGAAEAAGAHQLLAGALGAAVRLGLLGVMTAQRIRAELAAPLAAALALPVPDDARPSAFCPAAEIAAMRHETQAARLFAN